MKLKIEKVGEFKRGLIEHILKEWQAEAELLESRWESEIAKSSTTLDQGAAFSKKELAEQKARLEISQIQSPLNELKTLMLKEIPAQREAQVEAFSLFDVTVSELGKNKTTTYFLLPIQNLPKGKNQMNWNGNSIVLLNASSSLMGRSLNSSVKSEDGEVWEEPHMGHVVSTGRHTNDVRQTISAIYK